MDAHNVLREPRFEEDLKQFVQLIPTTPPEAITAGQPVMQAGRYNSLWVRLPLAVSSYPEPDKLLEQWLTECEGYKQGAVYVALAQVKAVAQLGECARYAVEGRLEEARRRRRVAGRGRRECELKGGHHERRVL